MRDILDSISKWWEAGDTFGLATVVSTFSSAPREPGAAMAVSAAGEVVGSVSGGCVEGAVYELAAEVVASGQPVLQRYGISDDTAFSVGLTWRHGASRRKCCGSAAPGPSIASGGTKPGSTSPPARHRARFGTAGISSRAMLAVATPCSMSGVTGT